MAALRSGATNPPTNDIVYRDLNITFAAHPVTKRVSVLSNEAAIKRAVRNLILTNRYEKFYNPLFGGNIRAMLFEQFTPSLRAEMTKRIEDTIRTYEPRARVLSVDVVTNVDQNELEVDITFQPINTTTPQNLKISLERIR